MNDTYKLSESRSFRRILPIQAIIPALEGLPEERQAAKALGSSGMRKMWGNGVRNHYVWGNGVRNHYGLRGKWCQEGEMVSGTIMACEERKWEEMGDEKWFLKPSPPLFSQ
jgi:hypothetical protein